MTNPARVPQTFDEFCTLVRSHFIPSNAIDVARDKIASLKQTKSAQDYANSFLNLTLQVPGMTDEEKKDRFIRGLKDKIRLEVRCKRPQTFEDAVQIAVDYDSIFFGESRKSNSSVGHSKLYHVSSSRVDSDNGSVGYPTDFV